MKAGDENYLLARDKGPVRRFIRDFVDSRFSLHRADDPAAGRDHGAGLLRQRTRSPRIGNTVLFGTILLVILDMLVLRFRLRRQLAARFPDAPTKGTTYYAVTRALQMKFMRLPKAQVKIGQELPEHYR